MKNTLSNVTGQIALQQQLVSTQQATLTQEFTHLEETLSQLSSESQFLSDSSSFVLVLLRPLVAVLEFVGQLLVGLGVRSTTMPDQNPASAYQSQAVQTANGPHLLLMLCDRMSVDIARAEVALEQSDNKAANEHLQHAQKIVRMLRNALDPEGFRGAHELLSVYIFLEAHLVKANMEKDAALVQGMCRPGSADPRGMAQGGERP